MKLLTKLVKTVAREIAVNMPDKQLKATITLDKFIPRDTCEQNQS